MVHPRAHNSVRVADIQMDAYRGARDARRKTQDSGAPRAREGAKSRSRGRVAGRHAAIGAGVPTKGGERWRAIDAVAGAALPRRAALSVRVFGRAGEA